MNGVIVSMTLRSLLGRRRSYLFLALSAIPALLALVLWLVAGRNDEQAAALLGGLALGTVVPLLCVLTGTGVIGPEIEDRSITYLLSKPLSRTPIVLSKYAVAVGVTWVCLIPAMVIPGMLLLDQPSLVLAYTVAAAVATLAYAALFLLLAILTRNAVIFGVLYAIAWETTVAGFVPGARNLSVRRWSLSVGEQLMSADAAAAGVTSEVAVAAAVPLLVALTVAALVVATLRLRTLRLTGTE